MQVDGGMFYSDKLVRVSHKAVWLRWYYFPFGTKRIRLEDIERIEIWPPGLAGGSWRIWGTGDFTTWFALDWSRPKRERLFVLVRRRRRMRCGFTVEDSQQFQQILQQLGIQFTSRSAQELERAARPKFAIFAAGVLLLLAVVNLALAIPMIGGWVAPSDTYGFKTAETLADEDLWYAANRFAGCTGAAAGLISGAIGLVVYWKRAVWPMWAPIACLVLLPPLYLMLLMLDFVYLNLAQ